MLRSMQIQTVGTSLVGQTSVLEDACFNLWLKQTRGAPRFAREVQRRVLHFSGSASVGCALFNSGRYAGSRMRLIQIRSVVLFSRGKP